MHTLGGTVEVVSRDAGLEGTVLQRNNIKRQLAWFNSQPHCLTLGKLVSPSVP